MLAKFEFASCYVFSPRGRSEASRSSQRIRDWVKAGNPEALPLAANRVRQFFDQGHFAGFFGPNVALVPVPGSAIFVPGALWVPQRLSHALRAVGLGHEVQELVRRVKAVPKSAFAAPGERPSPKAHYNSLEVVPSLIAPEAITLVDDVITKGSTLLGAASRMAEAHPNTPIRAFALLRTMGLVPEIEATRVPCVGTVSFIDDEAVREP